MTALDAAFDVVRLRAEEFPWTLDGATIYLNAVGTGPLPVRAVRSLEDWAVMRTRPWAESGIAGKRTRVASRRPSSGSTTPQTPRR